MVEMTAPDPAQLERLREQSGLSLDMDGRFFHEGVAVEHPRVLAAFRRGLGRAPDGRPTVTFGPAWAYLQVEDTLYQARRALCEAAGEALAACTLRLDDGTEEPLALVPGAVALDAAGVLYVRVKGGREWARTIPEAHAALGAFVVGEGDGLALRTTAGDLPLGRR